MMPPPVITILLSLSTIGISLGAFIPTNSPTAQYQSISRTRILFNLPHNNDDQSPSPRSEQPQDNRRRHFFPTSLLFLLEITSSKPATAAYGDSAGIELPNYIDFLIEKNKVDDPETFLYKGADREVQLQRLSSSLVRLNEIPKFAKEQRWSEVNSVLNGPLGTLLVTMNQVANAVGTAEAKEKAKKVKGDLIEVGQGAGRKNGEACVEAAGRALKDLEEFVKVAF